MRRVFSMLILMVFLPILVSAEDEEYITGYVVCQSDSFVNVRSTPSTKGNNVEGWLMCGDEVDIDRDRKGWVHCVNLPMESAEGWVHSGYIVYDEPIEVNVECTIIGKGRVAARRSINGDRRCWVHPGDIITVYWYSDEWCVTNVGFIKTKFISPVALN